MTVPAPPIFDMPPSAFYITGGTLPPDALSYVERQADHDLLSALLARDYCYVLNARQMGKSSLCVRTIGRLRQQNWRACFLDLTKFGSKNLNVEQWYVAMLAEAGRGLGLQAEFVDYWKQHKDIGPMQRFFGALREVALPASAAPFVVFIDEIDVTRSLPFSTDEFFAGIRQCFVERAVHPDLNRLVFCLLGTATPADLIQDTRTSPFNIGRRVEVRDFTPEEAAPLSVGLNHAGSGKALLERILYWTGGHPYLTQRLCRAAADADAVTATDIDRLCNDLFLSHTAKETDDNLAFVRNRLLKSEADLTALLELYRQVCKGRKVPDEDTNPLCGILKLSGVCRVQAGRLAPRNRIYADVFDVAWAEQHIPNAELRRQKKAFRRGLAMAGSVAGVVLSIMTGLTAWAIHNAHSANSARAAESKARTEAQGNALLANRNAEKAEGNFYAATMTLIQRDWEVNNIAHIQQLLETTKERGRGTFEWGYWNRLCHLDRLTLSAGVGVYAAAFSPDGRQIVTGNFDHSVRVWDAVTGKERLTLQGHKEMVSSVAFSPDAKRIATGSADETARVWDAVTGKALLILKEPRDPARSARHGYGYEDQFHPVFFSPDGKRLYTRSGGAAAMAWDAVTGRALLTFKGHSKLILALACSPDGRRIVTASADKTAKVWDAMSGQQLFTLAGHQKEVTCVAFSPDGRHIVTGSDDETIRTWDAQSGNPLLVLRGQASRVRAVAFSPDGRRIVSGSENNIANMWDAQTGKEQRTIRGHTQEVWAAAFSADGKRILTGSMDGTVKIWDANMPEEPLTLHEHANPIDSAAFAPDGRQAATGSKNGGVKIWDIQSGKSLRTLPAQAGTIECLAYSLDGSQIVIGRSDLAAKNGQAEATSINAAEVWDAGTGKKRLTLQGQTGGVNSVAWSSDGKWILMSRLDETAEVWNAVTGQKRFTLQAHDELLSHVKGNGVAFSPDGKWIVLMGEQDMAEVWDAATGQKRLTVAKPIYPGNACAISPDSRQVVTGSNMQGAEAPVWDVQTGKVQFALKGHTAGIVSVGFSPDGKRIVTGSYDGTVKVWDAVTGQELLSIKIARATAFSVAFSSDGKRLFACCSDHTVKAWFADDTRLPPTGQPE